LHKYLYIFDIQIATVMKITREHITYIVIAIVAIAAIILLTNLFSGASRPDNRQYEQSVALINKSLDLLTRSQEQNDKLHELIIQEKDQAKATADSLLIVVLNNQSKYIQLNKNYENIQRNINSIANDDDAIRRAFAER